MTGESISIIKPKTPAGSGWVDCGESPTESISGYEGRIWFFTEREIVAISSVEVVKNAGDKGPEYHLSISKNGHRCSRNEARFVLKCFGMTDAEEDNHVPGGFVRNYWLPVADPLIGKDCECKATETAIVEDGGEFIWRGANANQG
jgi:hypothetical protein